MILIFSVVFVIALLVALVLVPNSKPDEMVTYGTFPDEDERTFYESNGPGMITQAKKI